MQVSTDFGRRLKAARKHAGLTQKQVAAGVPMSQGTYSELETKAHGSTFVSQIATVCRVNVDWLATGEGEMLSTKGDTPKLGYAPPLSGGPGSGALLAQELSEQARKIDPKMLSWGNIMSAPLPETFTLVIQNNAMSPEFPSGSVILFSTREGEPRAGDAVLVADEDNNVFFREFQPRKPGHWIASALNPAFQPLDSLDDKLRVLAIKVGSWGRRG